ncbi:MAG: MotA/TolQ/ExbB proton channel family protein [Pseudomonadota bacterium]
MTEQLAQLQSLFNAGGTVLWVIALATLLMWALILERYWFLLRQLPPMRNEYLQIWQQRPRIDSDARERIKESLLNRFESTTNHSVESINMLTAVLPLLGLLGTVTGMIKIFEIMTVYGTGNVRGMAEGISEALITTMAGLITALSGVYFANHLQNKVQQERNRLSSLLEEQSRPVRNSPPDKPMETAANA